MERSRLVTGLLMVFVLVVAGTAVGGLPTVNYDGLTYVELSRVAESLQSQLDAPAEGQQARLRTGAHVVTLTRNWARVLLDGTPVSLDNPVRVRKGVWLVPESFVEQVIPKLTAAAAPPPAAAPAPAASPRPSPAAIAIEELRTRSYPSFTRVVVETTAPVVYKIESTGPKEARIRLVGLAGDPQVESILRNRRQALGLPGAVKQGVGRELADMMARTRSRGLDIGM